MPVALRLIRDSFARATSATVTHLHHRCSQLLAPTDEHPQGLIKIVDFGLAKSESEGPLKSNVGTERYKAPEIAPGASYDSKVDVWSLGCTLYEMLTAKGSLANRQNGVARMANASYKKGDMPLARELISRCLTEIPSARPTCRELLEDPFFQGRALPADPDPDPEPEPAVDSIGSMSSGDVEDEAADSARSLPSWGVDGSDHGAQSSGTLESWTDEEHAMDVILKLQLPERDARYLIEEGAVYKDLEAIGAGTDEDFLEELSDAAVATIKAWYEREQTLVAAKYMDATWAAQVATPVPKPQQPSRQLPDEVVGGGAAAPAPAAVPSSAATVEEGVPPDNSGDQTWSCAACTLQNAADLTQCSVCETPRGAVQPVAPVSRDAARADAATMQAIEAAVASPEFPSQDAF